MLTYDTWLLLPSPDSGTDEVVEGELRQVPIRLFPHAEVVHNLIASIAPQLDEDAVSILGSNLGLMISREPLTCRSPDLILFRRDQMEIHDGLYYSAPALVAEVISSSENRRRKEGKLADYARIGVPEVWLCDPPTKTLEVRRLTKGRMETASILTDGTVEPAEFPGIRVSVPEIWPE